MSAAGPDLSIIIPSYNEDSRLPATLESIAEYLADSGIKAEVVVVDDGSKDGTAAVAEYFRIKIPTLRVVSNGVNRGKGYSVRHGMQEAHGRIALFTDADRKSTRLNSSHSQISYAVFCLKKKTPLQPLKTP